MYFGPEWQTELDTARQELAHISAQLRGQFSWLDDWLAGQQATQKSFILGEHPGVADACAYYLVWFVRGRWGGGPDLLAEFEYLHVWEQKVKAIGHGVSKDMTGAQALDVALNSETITAEAFDERDPQGLKPGMTVGIGPDIDGGEVSVTGTVHAVSSETISVLRESERTGQVCVHFPRVGYRVEVSS